MMVMSGGARSTRRDAKLLPLAAREHIGPALLLAQHSGE
jgi:hypothetical protein